MGGCQRQKNHLRQNRQAPPAAGTPHKNRLRHAAAPGLPPGTGNPHHHIRNHRKRPVGSFPCPVGRQPDGPYRYAGPVRLGSPTTDSPVFASANYTLSFDALRSALAGTDAWILVLDTKGINVWCAAGKGTFGTGELIRRIAVTGLSEVVAHRKIILPQLGAPGVSAQEVARYSGFSVRYGPVRARDLPEYLTTHTATREMRTVRFPLADRLVLCPMELVHALLPMIAVAVVLYSLPARSQRLPQLPPCLQEQFSSRRCCRSSRPVIFP